MARKLTYIPNRVIDTNGISDGASIHVYATGTTTPVSIYSDESLTTPLANPYVVPAGAAVPEIYHGETGNIRVRVVESGGAVVSDDDPYQAPVTDIDLASTDAGKGVELVAGAGKTIATRAAMKALTSAADKARPLLLIEAGREGTFTFRSGDYSSQVAADPLEGIYVKADGISASVGVWVREYKGAVSVKWFGAKGDKVNNDGPAINAAISLVKRTIPGNGSELTGPAIYFPAGYYQTEENINLTSNAGVSLIGDGGTKSTLRGTATVTKLLNFDGGNNYRGLVKGMRLTGGIGGASYPIASHRGGGNQIHYKECWIDSCDTFIDTDGFADSTVKDCTFEFVKTLFSGSNYYDFEVTGCMFYNYGPVGSGTQPNPFSFANSRRVLFNDNRIIFDRASGLAAANTLIDLTGSHDCEVIKNIIYDRPGSTLPMRGVTVTNAQRCTVRDNNFGRFQRATVEVDNSKGIIVKDNHYVGVTDGAYYPLHVKNESVDCEISGNMAQQVSGVSYANLAGSIDILIENSERITCKDNKTRGVVYIQSNVARPVLSGNQKINGGASLLYAAFPPTGVGRSWEVGDYLPATSPSAGGYLGQVVVTAGTRGTLNGGATTGSITTGTTALTVSSATGLKIGSYISIAGVTGTKRVTAISGTSVTIDSNADATVSGAAVAYVDAVFKSAGTIAP